MSKTALMLYSALGHAYFHMFTAFYFVIVLSLEMEWQQPYHQLIELWTPAALLVGIFAIVAGWLGDRWSARGMLVIYFLGMGLSAIAAGYANNPLTLLLALSGIGLFGAIYHPIGIPLVIRNSAANQGKALAFNGVFGSLGAAMAGGVTGFLVDQGGSSLAFILPGVVVVATGAVMLVGLWRERQTPTQTPTQAQSQSARADSRATPAAVPHGRESVRKRGWGAPVLVLLFCLTAAGLIYHTVQTVMPKAFALGLPISSAGVQAVGFYVALVYAIGGLFQFVGGALADRYPLKVVYLGQFLAHGLLLLAAAYAGGFYLVVVVGMATALGAGALPAENMLLARYTSRDHHGLIFGLKFVLFFISGPVGVLLVSAIYQRTGQFVWVFGLLAITAAVIVLAGLMLPRKTPAAQNAESMPSAA